MTDLDDRDVLAAHLVDDGTISAEGCSEPGCDLAVADECANCGAELCAGGLFMHERLGCTVARQLQAASA